MSNRTALALILALAFGGLASCGDGGMEPPPPPPTSTTCSVDALAGLDVAASDFYGGTAYALGYSPYALDGCHLVYLAPSANGVGPGALVLRDLATGKEQTLAAAAEEPRRPSIAGEWITWEATVSGSPGVRVKGLHGDAVTIQGAFDHAGEPRAAADAIVFTAWLGPSDTSDSDIYLYRPGTQELVAVGATPKQQRFPDISATHLAWTDFGDDADGFYQDLHSATAEADVVIFNRATSAATTRHAPGKQAFPILGAAGRVAYLDWVGVQPEPKLNGYALQIADLDAPPASDAFVAWISTPLIHVRPIARGALLEWVEQPEGGASQLRRQRADLAAPAMTLPGLDGAQLVAPTASDALTLIGVRNEGAPVQLRAFSR